MAKLGGVYTIRSVDGGKTWDEPLPMNEGKQGAVRGNCVELEDGSLLLPYYVKGKAFVAVTKDRGKTWETRSTLAAQTDCLFHEPNLYRTASGKLIAFIRTLKQGNDIPDDKRSPLVTCESYDNGQTWVNHKEHPIFSPSPFHILRLQSGNVLLTYGHRLKPYGIRALLLNAECTNLDKAESIILRDDSPGFDIGYTSSVQLVNGEILVTYYYYEEQQELRYIAGTICKEEPLSSFD